MTRVMAMGPPKYFSSISLRKKGAQCVAPREYIQDPLLQKIICVAVSLYQALLAFLAGPGDAMFHAQHAFVAFAVDM